MKRAIFILFIVLCFMSCYTYWGAMRNIKPKLTNKIGAIETNMNMDGYYQYYAYKNNKDSFALNMMFFKDGTYIGNFFFNREINKTDISSNLCASIPYKITNRNDTILYGTWGIYRIENDTIIVQLLKEGDIIVQWGFWEWKYLILNDTTLQYLSYQDIYDMSPIRYAKKDDYSLAHFHPADSLPPSNPWFKKEKWAWKNEEDWKKYMNLKKRDK